MKIFTQDRKINFVDDNNVLVGFDNEQNCCESFGYNFAKSLLPDQAGQADEARDLEGFNFDPDFCKTDGYREEYEEGGQVAFRLTKGTEERFLILYNSHNGYYSHGFNMDVGGTTIHSGSL